MADLNVENEIRRIWTAIEGLKQDPILPDHFHNRYDASPINFIDIYQKKVWVQHTVYGTDAATATNYGVFYIVPAACYITKFQEVHQTAGSDGGAVTVTLEKLTGTTALDSGTDVLASVLSLKATANTVQTGTLTSTLGARTLAAGNRLALKDAGVLTAVANVTVLIELVII